VVVGSGSPRTNGALHHTGRLIVSRRLDTGELLSVTLPDDVGTTGGPTQAEFDALVARVSVLEATAAVDVELRTYVQTIMAVLDPGGPPPPPP
jgi:hypothetical protein